MIKKISSMGIVITKDKKVLLLNNEGEWVFPKGHVKEGETFIETAIREVGEESGVIVTKEECKGQIDEFEYYFDGEKAIKDIKVMIFLIDKIQPIKYNKQEGFIDGKWFYLNEAKKKLKHNDARASLEKVEKTFNLNKTKL